MATTKGKSNTLLSASCSSTENDMTSVGIKTWGDRVEEFTCNLEKKNIFDLTSPSDRFFLIKRTEGSFAQVSPFLIQKCLESFVGETKSVKKLKSGDLLVEVKNNKQAQNILKCKMFGNISVRVNAHKTLNSSRGVISEDDLIYVSETEVYENLKNQHVIGVKRITMHKNDEVIPTKHLILTFDLPVLPNSIKAGYLECSVRPYIPNPLRCFKCQKFGHSKFSCRGTLTCARCSEKGHQSDNCSAPVKCANCQKDHPAYSRSCEKWKLEKEIQAVKVKQNIAYPDAKKIVLSRTPNGGPSYSSVLSNPSAIKKQLKNVSTQTDNLLNAYQHVQNKSNISQNTNVSTNNEINNLQNTNQDVDETINQKISGNNKTAMSPSISNPVNKRLSSVNLPPVKSSSKTNSTIKLNRRNNKTTELLVNTQTKPSKKPKTYSTKASTSKENNSNNQNKNSQETLLKLYPSDRDDDMNVSSESEEDITNET